MASPRVLRRLSSRTRENVLRRGPFDPELWMI